MSMWKWITERSQRRTGEDATESEEIDPPVPIAPVPRHRFPNPIQGRYQSLDVYLERRYADRVVLTFGQIEDLLGFPLPDLARTSGAWWTARAGRTAIPNLSAQIVAFERAPGR